MRLPDHDRNFSSLHSAQFMGFVNALRTGDPTIDLLAALLLPVVLQYAMRVWPTVWKWILLYWNGNRKVPPAMCTRRIVHTTGGNGAGGAGGHYAGMHGAGAATETMNAHLIRAIKLYVHEKCRLVMADAAWELTPMEMSNTPHQHGGRNGQPSLAETLQSCALVERPLPHAWHVVYPKHEHDNKKNDNPIVDDMDTKETLPNAGIEKAQDKSVHNATIEIMIVDSVTGGGGGKQQKNSSPFADDNDNNNKQAQCSTEIQLRTTAGVATLNAFLHRAHTWYLQELKRRENADRYFFDLNSRTLSNRDQAYYTAYKLGDEKTFATLFSQECQDLRRIIDVFQQKGGKYAVPGYPYKLGLLLSGQPGTGKTSLIKALAHYTGRHIVNINLSRIRSNEELMACFFRSNYHIQQPVQHTLKLGFDQVIFVLEDVDASSEVVMDRKLLRAKKKKEAEKEKAKEAATAAAAAATATTATTASMPSGFTRRSATSVLPAMDNLNLSGLLNVLDGVVETPGRIVIMTTNHPEMLDPALVRPGRIDKQLVLSYMRATDVTAMVQHYYQVQELTDVQRRNIERAIDEGGLQITPAQVEQLAMETELVDDFVKALQKRLEQGGNKKKTKAQSPTSQGTTPESTSSEDEDGDSDGDSSVGPVVTHNPSAQGQPFYADPGGLDGSFLDEDFGDY